MGPVRLLILVALLCVVGGTLTDAEDDLASRPRQGRGDESRGAVGGGGGGGEGGGGGGGGGELPAEERQEADRRVLSIGHGGEDDNDLEEQIYGEQVSGYNVPDAYSQAPSYADPDLLTAVMQQAEQANFRYPLATTMPPSAPSDQDPSGSAADPSLAIPETNELNPFSLFPDQFHDLLNIPIHVYNNGSTFNPYEKFNKNKPRGPVILDGYANMKINGGRIRPSSEWETTTTPTVAYKPVYIHSTTRRPGLKYRSTTRRTTRTTTTTPKSTTTTTTTPESTTTTTTTPAPKPTRRPVHFSEKNDPLPYDHVTSTEKPLATTRRTYAPRPQRIPARIPPLRYTRRPTAASTTTSYKFEAHTTEVPKFSETPERGLGTKEPVSHEERPISTKPSVFPKHPTYLEARPELVSTRPIPIPTTPERIHIRPTIIPATTEKAHIRPVAVTRAPPPSPVFSGPPTARPAPPPSPKVIQTVTEVRDPSPVRVNVKDALHEEERFQPSKPDPFLPAKAPAPAPTTFRPPAGFYYSTKAPAPAPTTFRPPLGLDYPLGSPSVLPPVRNTYENYDEPDRKFEVEDEFDIPSNNYVSGNGNGELKNQRRPIPPSTPLGPPIHRHPTRNSPSPGAFPPRPVPPAPISSRPVPPAPISSRPVPPAPISSRPSRPRPPAFSQRPPGPIKDSSLLPPPSFGPPPVQPKPPQPRPHPVGLVPPGRPQNRPWPIRKSPRPDGRPLFKFPRPPPPPPQEAPGDEFTLPSDAENIPPRKNTAPLGPFPPRQEFGSPNILPQFRPNAPPQEETFGLQDSTRPLRARPRPGVPGRRPVVHPRPSFLENFNFFGRSTVNRRRGETGPFLKSNSAAEKDENKDMAATAKPSQVGIQYMLGHGPVPPKAQKVIVIGPFKQPPPGAPLIHLPDPSSNKKKVSDFKSVPQGAPSLPGAPVPPPPPPTPSSTFVRKNANLQSLAFQTPTFPPAPLIPSKVEPTSHASVPLPNPPQKLVQEPPREIVDVITQEDFRDTLTVSGTLGFGHEAKSPSMDTKSKKKSPVVVYGKPVDPDTYSVKGDQIETEVKTTFKVFNVSDDTPEATQQPIVTTAGVPEIQNFQEVSEEDKKGLIAGTFHFPSTHLLNVDRSGNSDGHPSRPGPLIIPIPVPLITSQDPKKLSRRINAGHPVRPTVRRRRPSPPPRQQVAVDRLIAIPDTTPSPQHIPSTQKNFSRPIPMPVALPVVSGPIITRPPLRRPTSYLTPPPPPPPLPMTSTKTKDKILTALPTGPDSFARTSNITDRSPDDPKKNLVAHTTLRPRLPYDLAPTLQPVTPMRITEFNPYPGRKVTQFPFATEQSSPVLSKVTEKVEKSKFKAPSIPSASYGGWQVVGAPAPPPEGPGDSHSPVLSYVKENTPEIVLKIPKKDDDKEELEVITAPAMKEETIVGASNRIGGGAELPETDGQLVRYSSRLSVETPSVVRSYWMQPPGSGL